LSSESSVKLASTLPSRDKHLSFLNVWLSEGKQLRMKDKGGMIPRHKTIMIN